MSANKNCGFYTTASVTTSSHQPTYPNAATRMLFTSGEKITLVTHPHTHARNVWRDAAAVTVYCADDVGFKIHREILRTGLSVLQPSHTSWLHC